jgi:hypothetical protein
MGYVTDIRKWRAIGELSTAYGVKGLMYGMKTLEGDGQGDYLGANGARLVHASKGYWLDAEGRSCGVKKARDDWASLRSDEQHQWDLKWEPRWEGALDAEAE